jgi:replicative DNA helicase
MTASYDSFTSARVPPHNLDAEIAVLGSVVLEPDSLLNRSVSQLKASDFYSERHRLIWSAFAPLRAQLTEDNQPGPVDLVLLSEELTRQGKLDDAGGLSYLLGLSDQTPTSAYAEHYARIVLEKAHLRAHISHAASVMRHAYDSDIALEDLDVLAGQPPRLTLTEAPVVRLGSVLGTVLDEAEHGTGNPGLSTGMSDLDNLIGGLEPGRLYILAARPAMGKTACAFQLLTTAARHGGRGLGFSLEMPAEEIGARLVCSEARVDLSRFAAARRGKTLNFTNLNGRDWERLRHAESVLGQLPLDILVKRGLSLSTLVDEVRRAHQQEPLSLFVLDYIQLVEVGSGYGNRNQDIGAITAALKSLAMELNIPVLALSQLSRDVEKRPNHRPMLSDLRDSGSLEQDADVVLFIYRDEYYNKETDQQGIAEIIVGKQRNGPVGTVKVSFHSSFTRFASLAS